HHHVEGADAVRRHEQEAPVARVVDVAHLAGVHVFQTAVLMVRSHLVLAHSRASRASKIGPVLRRARRRSKASFNWAGVSVTSASASSKARNGRPSFQAVMALRCTMR